MKHNITVKTEISLLQMQLYVFLSVFTSIGLMLTLSCRKML